VEETSGDYRPRYLPQFLLVVCNLLSALSQYGTADGGARSVPRLTSKVFGCKVISQAVHISLRRRLVVGGNGKLFVHCSERDCQYVDSNERPCPLTLDLFAAEIQERMAQRPE